MLPHRRAGLRLSALCLALLPLITGCRSGPRCQLPPAVDPPESARERYPAPGRTVTASLSATLAANAAVAPTGPKPLQVLALSGGVEGAPYAAGVLVGWTRSGTRPTFDVVTGISSGALIGAFAFLGPKYDADLERLARKMQCSDLFRLRPLTGPICYGAFGTTKPAERLLRAEIHDGFLADLRQAHAEGRRFFVGTMTLQTKRLVIWDLGAIASSGRPDADETVRKVLLAAFSYPGLAPPVELNLYAEGRCYQEEHCDAGLVTMAFVRFGSLADWPEPGSPVRPGWLAGSNLYVLTSKKLYPDPVEVPKRAVYRGTTALTAVLQALTREQINHMYSLCAVSGMQFHLLAVPAGYGSRGVSFCELYPEDAPALFALGEGMAAAGPPWRRTPPGAEPGEEAMPRDGGTVVAPEE